MSKYEPLWKYLKENNKDNYLLSYEEIKNKFIIHLYYKGCGI